MRHQPAKRSEAKSKIHVIKPKMLTLTSFHMFRLSRDLKLLGPPTSVRPSIDSPSSDLRMIMP